MQNIISVQGLSKSYASGFQALKGVNLDIHPGEILALLGPNGAGKTTFISIVCGIVTASAGRVTVGGFDTVQDYRQSRSLTFLGGSFYSIKMLPPVWQTISLFNPVVYLVSGFRWCFLGKADVDVVTSLGMTIAFTVAALGVVGWIFKTGWRLKR